MTKEEEPSSALKAFAPPSPCNFITPPSEANESFDIVISLCDSANELCPVFPGNIERIHWNIPDPFTGWSDRDVFLTYYRACRNLLKEHIDQFLKD